MLQKQTLFKSIPSKFSKYEGLLIGLSLLYFFKVLHQGEGDFSVYYGAAKAFRLHEPIYCVDFPIGQNWCGYSYPPFFLALIAPFTFLPLWLLDWFWLVLNLFLLFRIFKLITDFLDVKTDFTVKQTRLWIALTLLFSVRFILYNYDMSQSNIVLLWGSLESLFLIHRGRWFLGSLILATVISVKLIPLVFIPYLMYRNHWKSALATVGFVLFLNVAPSVYYGFDAYFSELKTWREVVNFTTPEFTVFQNQSEESIHSLSAFVPAFLNGEIFRYNIRRNIVDMNYQEIGLALNLFRLLFILLSLLFLRTLPFKKIENKQQIFFEISYLFLAAILIFPHQQKHGFVMLLPAMSYVLYFILKQKNLEQNLKSATSLKFNDMSPFLKKIIGLMVAVWLLTTASTDGIVGRNLFDLGQYFKLITWGTMLLMIPLSMCRVRF